MDDPARMRVGERGRDRQRDLGGLRPGERAVARDVAEVRPLDELHHEKRGLAVLAVVVEADDVLVLEGREDARLACEPTPKLEILGDPRVEELDRDITAQAPVAGAPDGAHATFADASTKLVAAGDEVGHVRERRARRGFARAHSGQNVAVEASPGSCKEKEKSRIPGIPLAVKPLYTVTTSFPPKSV